MPNRIALALAVVSALLYACLLPLWKGFDEPFHYGYVQSLSAQRHIPVPGRDTVSAEIAASFKQAPVSYIVHRGLGGAITFDEWFRLSAGEREERNRRTAAIPREFRQEGSDSPNYEAHHPPLAYALLASVDALAASIPLRRRILLLRLLLGTASALLTVFACQFLFQNLGLSKFASLCAFAFVLQSQMLWASVTHVANDWLAIPLAVTLFGSLAAFVGRDEKRHPAVLAVVLSLGLLTKAYFLVFVPLVVAAIVWEPYNRRVRHGAALGSLALILATAGPWYLRNLALYGNIGGTREAAGGIGLRQVWDAIPKIDWPRTAGFMARSSLWTGNGSFTSFSRSTLNLELILLAAAVIFYLARWRRITPREWWILTGIGVFIAALGYAACASWAYNRGNVPGASPWYAQVLLAPIAGIVFLGLHRAKAAGRPMATLLILVSTWIYCLTYFGKLFPLYSGYSAGRSTLRDLVWWWVTDFRGHSAILSATALAPAGVLYVLALVLLGCQAMLVRSIFIACRGD